MAAFPHLPPSMICSQFLPSPLKNVFLVPWYIFQVTSAFLRLKAFEKHECSRLEDMNITLLPGHVLWKLYLFSHIFFPWRFVGGTFIGTEISCRKWWLQNPLSRTFKRYKRNINMTATQLRNNYLASTRSPQRQPTTEYRVRGGLKYSPLFLVFCLFEQRFVNI